MSESTWLDKIYAALADFDRPGHTLEHALSAQGATPEELGRAVRAVFGMPQPGNRPVDCLDAAARLRGKLDGLSLGLRDGLPIRLHEFEQQVAAQLRGKPEDQQAAGLVLSSEFTRFGRSAHGHILADPAGTAWAGLLPPNERFQSGGSWLVLGWPRGGGPRVIYRTEDVVRYTKQLESERRHAQDEHDQEQRRREEADRRAWERSDAGRIVRLETELAALKAKQPAA